MHDIVVASPHSHSQDGSAVSLYPGRRASRGGAVGRELPKPQRKASEEQVKGATDRKVEVQSTVLQKRLHRQPVACSCRSHRRRAAVRICSLHQRLGVTAVIQERQQEIAGSRVVHLLVLTRVCKRRASLL